jgi:hypothetical protein
VSTVYAGDVPCGRCSRPLPSEGPPPEATARCSCGTEQRVLRFRPFRAPAAAPAPAGLEADGTPCAYHAGNAASASCSRCGSFVCALCATPVAGATWCPACFERQRHQEQGLRARLPTPHHAALALGLLSLLMVALAPLTAPLALWQAWRAWSTRAELEERDRGVVLRAVAGAVLALAGLGLLGYATYAIFREAT